MKTNCNALIKENNIIIRDFEITFKSNILKFTKENLLKPEGHFDYVPQYVSTVYSDLYTQINKTIIVLDKNICTIIERYILGRHLVTLYYIFFEFLENSIYKSDYWKISEEQVQQYFDFEYTFIELQDFNKNYVLQLINNLDIGRNKIDVNSENKNSNNSFSNETWFEIALEFANGNIYKYLKDGKSQVETADILFKNRKIKSSSYRPWINFTISDTENDKNIFKRTNSIEELQAVYFYCVENQINIAEKFIVECKKHNINFITH